MPWPPLQGGGSVVTEEARPLGLSHSQEIDVLLAVRGERGPQDGGRDSVCGLSCLCLQLLLQVGPRPSALMARLG